MGTSPGRPHPSRLGGRSAAPALSWAAVLGALRQVVTVQLAPVELGDAHMDSTSQVLTPGFFLWDHTEPGQGCGTICVTSSQEKGEGHQTCHPSTQWPQRPKPMEGPLVRDGTREGEDVAQASWESLALVLRPPRVPSASPPARKGEGVYTQPVLTPLSSRTQRKPAHPGGAPPNIPISPLVARPPQVQPQPWGLCGFISLVVKCPRGASPLLLSLLSRWVGDSPGCSELPSPTKRTRACTALSVLSHRIIMAALGSRACSRPPPLCMAGQQRLEGEESARVTPLVVGLRPTPEESGWARAGQGSWLGRGSLSHPTRRALLSTSPFGVNSSATSHGGNPRRLGLPSPSRFSVSQPRCQTLGVELEVTPEPVVQLVQLWGRRGVWMEGCCSCTGVESGPHQALALKLAGARNLVLEQNKEQVHGASPKAGRHCCL